VIGAAVSGEPTAGTARGRPDAPDVGSKTLEDGVPTVAESVSFKKQY